MTSASFLFYRTIKQKMDDDDEFYDTLSLNSQYSLAAKKRSNNKDYMSLSRNTVYHSAYDLDAEMTNLEPSRNRLRKVSKNPKAVTYREWRDRVLFIEKKTTGTLNLLLTEILLTKHVLSITVLSIITAFHSWQ